MHRISLSHLQYSPSSWFVCINVLNDLCLPASASLNESIPIGLGSSLAEGRTIAVDDDMAELSTITVHHNDRCGYRRVNNTQHGTIRTCRFPTGVQRLVVVSEGNRVRQFKYGSWAQLHHSESNGKGFIDRLLVSGCDAR